MKSLIAMIFTFVTSYALAGWFALESGTTQHLRDIAFFDHEANSGVIVGDSGTVLRSWDGNWSPVESGTHDNLRAVSFYSYALGVAVGEQGTILKTTNRGWSWEIVAAEAGITYYDVTQVDEYLGIAVGDSGGTITRLTISDDGWQSFRTIHLSLAYNGGPDSGTLVSIAMLDSQSGVVAARHSDGTCFMISTTNGWESVWGPIRLDGNVHAMVMSSLEYGFAVGDNGLIYRANGQGFPQSWNYIHSDSQDSFRSVSMRPGEPIWAVGLGGAIWVSPVRGLIWEEQTSETTANLYGVWAVSDRVAYAVGEHGTILKTTDAGGLQSRLPGAFEILSPPADTLLPRSETEFVWSRSIHPLGYRVSYAVTLVIDTIELPYMVDDTTMVFNFESFQDFRDRRVTALLFVQALDSLGMATSADNSPLVFRLEADLAAPEPPPVPAASELQIAPNPFNATTTIRYTLETPQRISLDIFDTAGRLVKTLAQGEQSAGAHAVKLEAQNLASGIYFARLQTETSLQFNKLVLLK